MKLSIKDFYRKCEQIRRKLRICSHLLKKSIMENLMFCAVVWENVTEVVRDSKWCLNSREFPKWWERVCSLLQLYTNDIKGILKYLWNLRNTFWIFVFFLFLQHIICLNQRNLHFLLLSKSVLMCIWIIRWQHAEAYLVLYQMKG